MAIPAGALADVAALVLTIPNGAAFDARGAWLTMAHAIAGVFESTPDGGCSVWSQWCDARVAGEVTDGKAEAVWDSIDGDEHRAGLDFILSAAGRAGVPLPASLAKLKAEAAATSAQDEFAEYVEDAPADVVAAEGLVRNSEDALAAEFTRRHAGQLVHIEGFGGWFKWSGHVFTGPVRTAAFDLARGVARDAAVRLTDEKSASLARHLVSKTTIANIAAIAANDPAHARRLEEFDRDPWLLNSPAGVIDLRTGEIRPQRRGEPFLKSAAVAPAGDCPRWRRFLQEITHGDQAIADYLQRWAGYSCTGINREHAFLFMWGEGGNGKSLFLKILASALGSYAATASANIITAGRNEPHLTHVAALAGARLAIIPEVERGRTWAETMLKGLTAGDTQRVNLMRQDTFEFDPVLKLMVAGNHKPSLQSLDDAMKRRLHFLHLTYRPPVADMRLEEALRAEGPGILAWMIEGCLLWQKQGLSMPPAVRASTDTYFAEQDILGHWLGARCVCDGTVKNDATGARALFEDWSRFASAGGERPQSEKWFSTEMVKRHFAKESKNTGNVFLGIRLIPEDQFPA